MRRKEGQIWEDLYSSKFSENLRLYLILKISKTAIKIQWLSDGSVCEVHPKTCAPDLYVRDVSSLEKELL
jgi:hypothetical protein